MANNPSELSSSTMNTHDVIRSPIKTLRPFELGLFVAILTMTTTILIMHIAG